MVTKPGIDQGFSVKLSRDIEQLINRIADEKLWLKKTVVEQAVLELAKKLKVSK